MFCLRDFLLGAIKIVAERVVREDTNNGSAPMSPLAKMQRQFEMYLFINLLKLLSKFS